MASLFSAPIQRLALAPTLAALIVGTATTADGAFTVDRWYRMGDDSGEGADPGESVGADSGFNSTFDSVGIPGQSFQDLTPNGGPVYVDVSGDRPVPGNTGNNLAIQLDGVDDYLSGFNLNSPENSVAAGAEGYAGVTDRGYQLWVKPTNLDGRAQYIIDDADEHGHRISTAGFYGSEIRDNSVISDAAAQENTWAHLMLVRPSGNSGGARAWVDGLAASSHTGSYDQAATLDLFVGANVEEDVGLTQDPNLQDPPTFFAGIVDELEMFVVDDGTTFGAFDYTEDNGYFTDVFLPSQAGYGFTLDPSDGRNAQQWVEGDINFDGAFDTADVDAFVAGWLSTGGDVGPGPDFGDYVTLGLGDLDLDGDTDLDDFFSLRAAAQSAGVSTAAAGALFGVPEPGAGCLVVSSLVALLSRRRTL